MQVFFFIALKNVRYAFDNILILMCSRRAAMSEHTVSFVKTFSTAEIAEIQFCSVFFYTESKYSISIENHL